MNTSHHLLHQARLNNKCPNCYDGSGLEISFHQTIKENKLYSKVSRSMDEKLFCHHCESQIYPVNWDEDIERVYQYHKKLARPKPSGIKLKPLAYMIILLDAIALAALIYYLR